MNVQVIVIFLRVHHNLVLLMIYWRINKSPVIFYQLRYFSAERELIAFWFWCPFTQEPGLTSASKNVLARCNKTYQYIIYKMLPLAFHFKFRIQVYLSLSLSSIKFKPKEKYKYDMRSINRLLNLNQILEMTEASG